MQLNISLKPWVVGLWLGIIALHLVLQSLIGEYFLTNIIGNNADTLPAELFDLFSVNAETTIPTWYSVVMLLSAAVLLAFIAKTKYDARDRFSIHWIGLAVVFLYLSIDEGASIHEITSDPLQAAFQTSGYLNFGWVLLGIPVVIILGLLFLRFLLHLSARTRNLFILAGVVYIGGAIVIEAISANQLPAYGDYTFQYLGIATIEEFFEMLGVIIFIYALLDYITRMRLAFVFNAPSLPAEPPQPSGFAEMPTINNLFSYPGFLRALRLAVPFTLLTILVNLGILYWAMSLPRQINVVQVDRTAPFHQMLIDQVAGNNLLVSHLPGKFGFEDNPPLRNYLASLQSTYDQIMVITFPSKGISTILAGDKLPYDRNTLSAMLRISGEAQFIIFDPQAVQMLLNK